MKFLYEFKLFTDIKKNSKSKYGTLSPGSLLLSYIKDKKLKIVSNNKSDIDKLKNLSNVNQYNSDIAILYSSEKYPNTLFKKAEIKKIVKSKNIKLLKDRLKQEGYLHPYIYMPRNNQYWVFATKNSFKKFKSLKVDSFIEELNYQSLFNFFESIYSEEPEIETLPKPKDPDVDPDIEIAPKKPTRRDPFRRRPNIDPGEEPRPKAKVSEAVKYDRTRGRMNPDIEDKLATGKHLYGKMDAFPPLKKDNIKNYSEYLAGKRFNELVTKIRHYSKDRTFDDFDIDTMQRILMTSLMRIIEVEKRYRTRLEKIAVKVVSERFMIKKGSLQFNAKIVDLQAINLDNINKKCKDGSCAMQADIAPKEVFDFEAEVQKRRIINGMISGAANKGHFLFNLVRKELNSIDKDLVNLYGLMISSNDLSYWLLPDLTISMMGEQESAAGKVRVDLSTDPPTIHAEAINFPALIHELIKGVMEFLSLFGLPEDKKYRKAVLDAADFLDSEMWDLRLGPGIWQNFIDAIGGSEDDIKHILYTELVQMPAKEFNAFMKEILSKSKKGKQMLVDLANDIRKDLKEEDYTDAMKAHREKSKFKKPKDKGGSGDIPFNFIWN